MPFYEDLGNGQVALTTPSGAQVPVLMTPEQAESKGYSRKLSFNTLPAEQTMTPAVPSAEQRYQQLGRDIQATGTSKLTDLPAAPYQTPTEPGMQTTSDAEKFEKRTAIPAGGSGEMGASRDPSKDVSVQVAQPREGGWKPPGAEVPQGETKTRDYVVVRGSAGTPGGWTLGAEPRSYARMEAASREAAKAREEALRGQVIPLEAQSDRAKGEAAKHEARAAQYESGIDAALARLDQDRKDLSNQKVDPRRVFSSMPIWGKILLALAAGAEGYAGKSGAQSITYNMVNNAIQRDIQAQEMSIALRKKGIDVQENMLDRYMHSHDPAEARKLATVALREAAAAEAEMLKLGGLADALRSENEADLAKIQVSTMKYRAPQGGSRGGVIDMELAKRGGWASPEGRLLVPQETALKLQSQFLETKGKKLAEAEGGGGGGSGFTARATARRGLAYSTLEGAEKATIELASKVQKARDKLLSINPITNPNEYLAARAEMNTFTEEFVNHRAAQKTRTAAPFSSAAPANETYLSAKHELGPSPTLAGRILPFLETSPALAKKRLDTLLEGSKAATRAEQSELENMTPAQLNAAAEEAESELQYVRR